jgi:hypothetical protein
MKDNRGDNAMRFSTIITLTILLMLVGIAGGIGCSNSNGMSAMRFAVTGPGGGDGDPNLQGSIGGGPPATPGGGRTPPRTGMSDVSGAPGAPPTDPNIADALAGIRDFEITSQYYDTSKSHADNTPPELRDLGVVYAGPESPVAQRTEALRNLNLVNALKDRYQLVEDAHAADPEKDFSPSDPSTTLNYFQPRTDPFSIPDLIPDELRPKTAGAGLEGSVDPELLNQLLAAQFEAGLRYIPIVVTGVLETGPYHGAIISLYGSGQTIFMQEGGSPRCFGRFSIQCAQASEDFVVLYLVGYSGRRCSGEATGRVVRTFHVSR